MRDIILSEVPRFAKKASDKGKEAVIKYLREQVPPHKKGTEVDCRLKKQFKKLMNNGLNLKPLKLKMIPRHYH